MALGAEQATKPKPDQKASQRVKDVIQAGYILLHGISDLCN
jgi:hypothetical protein